MAIGLAILMPGDGRAQQCNPDEDTTIPRILLVKRLSYTQDDQGTPILDAFMGPAVAALAVAPAGSGFTSATLTTPSGGIEQFFGTPQGLQILFRTFDTAAELESMYPSGTYTLNLELPDRRVTARLPQKAMSVVVEPQVTNYRALQAADPQTDITIRFNGINQPSPGDTISLAVEQAGENVFFIPNSCLHTSLANTSTSVVIPKGTLRPNTLYFASLAFVKQAGTDHSINGIPATSGNSKVTAFQIFTGTQVTPPRQPVLIEAGFNPNGSFHLTVQADPGQTCLIQSQQDLSGTWSTRATLSSPDGILNFDDNQAGPAPFRFYRAVTVP